MSDCYTDQTNVQYGLYTCICLECSVVFYEKTKYIYYHQLKITRKSIDIFCSHVDKGTVKLETLVFSFRINKNKM